MVKDEERNREERLGLREWWCPWVLDSLGPRLLGWMKWGVCVGGWGNVISTDLKAEKCLQKKKM